MRRKGQGGGGEAGREVIGIGMGMVGVGGCSLETIWD